MPLIKSTSPEAFAANVKAELKAGKSQAQAVAIAEAVKKAAELHEKHKSKYANRYKK